MQLSGPFTYRITFNSDRITGVIAPNGDTKFSGEASIEMPKLYVISDGQQPLYVGVTKQRVRSRLSYGFQSKGSHGYHGYEWRHKLSCAHVDIWVQRGQDRNLRCMETVEAEVVYLIRKKYGQWPKYQTEIHFHPSDSTHRMASQRIVNHYGSANAQPAYQ